MQSRQYIDWQMARSHIYGLLGGLLSRQPDAQTLNALLSPEAVENLASLFADPAVGRHFHRMAEQYAAGELKPDHVGQDYENLMRVPGPAYTHPFESFYCRQSGGKEGLNRGRLDGRAASEAERYYRSEDVLPNYDTVDFADHIAAELDFMARLCECQAAALADGDMQTASRLEDKQKRFGSDHLFRWAEDFCAALKAGAQTPFFKGLAQILHAFIDMEICQ
ncbi:MAG: molecular chaperone TorD family protein [Desulfobacteraceae bacterium]|jgi:TorA maturation chaperone TorD